uniref:Uncharacterized protein n=1 Tax=Zosterops lateralis melanops TaxID=1220523 RepID=A0A8D2PN84_ZOSLA
MRDCGIFSPAMQIQNTHTGLDLSVPEYQEIRGKMMSGHVEYHIVVVTRLAAFKSAKHKPEDVVQFMVSLQGSVHIKHYLAGLSFSLYLQSKGLKMQHMT